MSGAVQRLRDERKAVRELLVSTLADLAGLAPEGIRDRLVADGVKGEPRDCVTCPVAVWLTARTGLPDVEVGCERVLSVGVSAVAPLPLSVREFIRRFDMYDEFPELVRQP